MNESPKTGPSRREVLKATGSLAAASALAGVALPHVHAAEDNTIRVALVGCGGRGTGAAENALSVKYGPVKLVAMADVFEDQLNSAYDSIRRRFEKQMDVPEDRRFIGFDGYKKAMDCLKPGDIAIFATPPAFRWPHFAYAVQKGLHVFMEKPVAVDGPSARKMFKLGEEAKAKNLKVGVGLMCRHCVVRQELHDRIKDGQMGDILLMRAYRLAGPTASAFSKRREVQMPKAKSELEYQIRRFHSFLWLSGGAYSDFLIHNIDECSWMKDAFPVKARSSGGRHYRGDNVDQNFDTYSTEFTYADGTKLLMEGRCMPGCEQQFSSFAHGSKGAAIISWSGHFPSKARIFKGQNISLSAQDVVWKGPAEEPVPYQTEWDHLVEAIRQDKPYNEVERGTEASLVTSMGRMAAHTGRDITRDQMLNCEHEFAPNVDTMTIESPAPIRADKDGKYPIPEPGKKTKREY